MVSKHPDSISAAVRAAMRARLIAMAAAPAAAALVVSVPPVLAQEAPVQSPLLAQGVSPAQGTPGQHPGPAPQDAQAQSPSTGLQEVVVTGSHILRSDFKSDSPMVSVSSETLQNAADVRIDQQLDKLPQFVPGANQFSSANDVQATPTNSPGISTVNLRGLGANRTLVLLDGRRTQPANASLVVDLNTIPAAAIDSVEIITGGAASTYGADAVAGVVNFKLKQHYEGVTIDAQSGQTTYGDGAQTQVDMLLGSNFADNRGNALVGLNFAKSDATYQIDRPFFRRAFTDPGAAGVNAFPNFPGFTGVPSQAAVDSIFTPEGYPPGDVPAAQTLTYYFNTAPTTAGSTIFTVNPGAVSGKPAPGYTGSYYPNYKLLSNGTLSSNAPEGFLTLPLTRYSAFAHGYYDVNEHLTFYAQLNFEQNATRTQSGASAPAFNQWSVNIPYDAAHPVPPELATLLNSRSNPTAPWTLYNQLDFMGPESIDTLTHTYEFLAGLRGTLGIKDWTYDLFGSHGDTNQLTHYHGFVDFASYQALIAMPNYGAGADFNYGRTGLLAHCTSGLNPFLNTPVSQDCINILQAQIATTTDVIQKQVELDIQGGLFDLPAGELRFAVGADYRKDDFSYVPDRSISTTNITSLTIGLFDTSPTSGAIGVSEGYFEVLAPLLKDLPAVKSLNLDGGYRYSSYDTATGGVSTWKLTADWDVNGWIKFRGGRQIANRAPNVAELFQPAVYVVVPWPDADPCSKYTRAPYGNVATNPNRTQVLALCSALSGGYPFTTNFTGSVPAYFPLGRDVQQGNPNLSSEDAETWTVGTVLQSPFDVAALRRLTLSVDYYNIVINGAIAPATTETTYQECFNAYGTNPTYSASNPFCQLIIRLPNNGFWSATKALYENLGSIKTSGIDAELDWSANAPGIAGQPGAVFANVNFNWLQAYDVQNVAGGPVLHYAGTIGAPITAPPYGAQFRWKLFTTLGYKIGPATASLDWRHLPSVQNFDHATNPASTTLATASYDEFDLALGWSITEKFEIRGGIDNLFDRQPNTVGVVPGVTTAAGVTDPAGAYDVLGQRFYVGVTARF